MQIVSWLIRSNAIENWQAADKAQESAETEHSGTPVYRSKKTLKQNFILDQQSKVCSSHKRKKLTVKRHRLIRALSNLAHFFFIAQNQTKPNVPSSKLGFGLDFCLLWFGRSLSFLTLTNLPTLIRRREVQRKWNLMSREKWPLCEWCAKGFPDGRQRGTGHGGAFSAVGQLSFLHPLNLFQKAQESVNPPLKMSKFSS